MQHRLFRMMRFYYAIKRRARCLDWRRQASHMLLAFAFNETSLYLA